MVGFDPAHPHHMRKHEVDINGNQDIYESHHRKAVEIFLTPRRQGPPNRRLAVQSWDESPQTSHLSGQWIG